MTMVVGAQLDQLAADSNCLISWVSFEERCMSAAEVLRDIPRLAVHLFHFHEKDYDISSHHNRLKDILSGKIISDTTFDRSKQFTVFQKIEKTVEHALLSSRCIIDISCFPREALLILIFVLSRNQKRLDSVFLVYSVAADYNSTENDQSKKWLSRGVADISPIYGFRGKIVPGRKLAVVGMLGLDERRFVEAIDVLQPDHLSIGVGATSEDARSWLYEKNHQVAKDLNSAFDVSDLFMFDCDSIQSAQSALMQQVKNFGDYNVCIVPMNNKLSTVAAGLVALQNRSIQICHGGALVYNMVDYSSKSDKFIYYRFSDIFATLSQRALGVG